MSCKRIARYLALPALLAGTALLAAEPPAGIAGKSRPLGENPYNVTTRGLVPQPPSARPRGLEDPSVREVLEAFQRHMQHDAAHTVFDNFSVQSRSNLLKVVSPKGLKELQKNMIRGQTIHLTPQATRSLQAQPGLAPKIESHRSPC